MMWIPRVGIGAEFSGGVVGLSRDICGVSDPGQSPGLCGRRGVAALGEAAFAEVEGGGGDADEEEGTCGEGGGGGDGGGGGVGEEIDGDVIDVCFDDFAGRVFGERKAGDVELNGGDGGGDELGGAGEDIGQRITEEGESGEFGDGFAFRLGRRRVRVVVALRKGERVLLLPSLRRARAAFQLGSELSMV